MACWLNMHDPTYPSSTKVVPEKQLKLIVNVSFRCSLMTNKFGWDNKDHQKEVNMSCFSYLIERMKFYIFMWE